jgi:hypothetical protein
MNAGSRGDVVPFRGLFADCFEDAIGTMGTATSA